MSKQPAISALTHSSTFRFMLLSLSAGGKIFLKSPLNVSIKWMLLSDRKFLLDNRNKLGPFDISMFTNSGRMLLSASEQNEISFLRV